MENCAYQFYETNKLKQMHHILAKICSLTYEESLFYSFHWWLPQEELKKWLLPMFKKQTDQESPALSGRY